MTYRRALGMIWADLKADISRFRPKLKPKPEGKKVLAASKPLRPLGFWLTLLVGLFAGICAGAYVLSIYLGMVE